MQIGGITSKLRKKWVIFQEKNSHHFCFYHLPFRYISQTGPALVAFTLMMAAFSLRTWRRNGVACDELIFLPGTQHGHRIGVVDSPLVESIQLSASLDNNDDDNNNDIIIDNINNSNSSNSNSNSNSKAIATAIATTIEICLYKYTYIYIHIYLDLTSTVR